MRALLARTIRTVRELPEVARIVRDPRESQSYFPGEPRKSRLRMFLDNAWYLAKNGEISQHYFPCGFDRRGAERTSEISMRDFKRLRNGRNRVPVNGLMYSCLLDDKYVFGQVASSLGYRVPRNLAFVDGESVDWLDADRRRREPLSALLAHELDVFCKPYNGIKGGGAFALRVTAGTVEIDGRPATMDALSKHLDRRCLMQERVVQHPALAALHAPSLNTLRIVTVRDGAGARLFTALLRIGARGAHVDNLANGGVGIPLDPGSGRLRGVGLQKPGIGTRVTHHPDTGVKLDGYEIPFALDAIHAVCRFHADLPAFHTIGWDVGIAPDGPVIIEGNDNWNIRLDPAFEPDFRSRLFALFEPGR